LAKRHRASLRTVTKSRVEARAASYVLEKESFQCDAGAAMNLTQI
jgi:hypothetical protein